MRVDPRKGDRSVAEEFAAAYSTPRLRPQ
jgi:hypothetical protein